MLGSALISPSFLRTLEVATQPALEERRDRGFLGPEAGEVAAQLAVDLVPVRKTNGLTSMLPPRSHNPFYFRHSREGGNPSLAWA
jgi:hypothetical protein